MIRAYKYYDFAQTRSHNRETVTFRNSAGTKVGTEAGAKVLLGD